jgi:PIN domain
MLIFLGGRNLDKKNIFIDTCIFKQHKFAVNQAMFNTLRSLCDSNKIQLLSTDITISEIEAGIEKSVEDLRTAFKKIAFYNRTIGTTKGKDCQGFTSADLASEIDGDIKKQITVYLQDCNASIIDASNQNAQRVFQDYFSKNPPFGKGKKKHEFPDAFVLSALKNWCIENQAQIVAISTDGDFKKFCQIEEQFSHYANLYTFLNAILKEDDTRISVIRRLIEENQDRISKDIEKAIETIGVYIGDAEGEVFLEKITDYELLETSIVGLNGNQADIFCVADLTLLFETSYWDPDSWTSMKDDGVKEIFYHSRIDGEAERTLTTEIEFEIHFDAEKFNLINIKDLKINSGEPLEYSHYNEDPYG